MRLITSKTKLLGALLLCAATASQATPYRPTSSSTVIDTLPTGSSTYETRLITHPSGANPASPVPFALVEPQIGALLARAYSQGDPRAMGQAASLLEPYSKDNSPNVRLLRANILQASHDFDGARRELQAILRQVPNQPDSVLMLSSIDLVQGHFDAAAQGCGQIRDMGLLVLRFACLAQVDAMTGKLQSSRDTLQKLAGVNNGLTPEQQRWLNLILADMALRLDDPILAKSVFEQLDGSSAPSLTARADWLLAHHAWAQTQQLLAGHTDNDALLLRLVMAELRLNDPHARDHFQLLAERMAVWQARGETAHQREQATFALMQNPPSKALELARLNWQKQRETADVVIYANAALRAQSQADLQVLQTWIKQTGFEYPRLNSVVLQALNSSNTASTQASVTGVKP
jgi:hypothetical protein